MAISGDPITLSEVRIAIRKLLVAQSYSIGGQTYTRANLPALRQLEKDLAGSNYQATRGRGIIDHMGGY